jgi:antitoxin (DNA-binding transcriptional repressor) of toxin-antitoxin stability system
MAVIHISEAEAARDLPALLAKVRAGEEIRIATNTSTIALTAEARRKTLSEAIRLAEERDEDITLDDQFSTDLDAVVMNHEHEAGSRDPWLE